MFKTAKLLFDIFYELLQMYECRLSENHFLASPFLTFLSFQLFNVAFIQL